MLLKRARARKAGSLDEHCGVTQNVSEAAVRSDVRFVFMGQLRKKLEQDPSNLNLLGDRTVGRYRFNPNG